MDRMIRRMERGASYVPLIIVLVLLIVAVVWAYLQTERNAELVRELQAARQSESAQQQQYSELSGYVRQELSPSIGFAGTQSFGGAQISVSQNQAVRAFIQEKLEALKSRTKTVPLSVFQETDTGGLRLEETGDRVKIIWVRPATIPSETTLQELYMLMDTAMNRMASDIQNLAQFAKDRQQDLVAAQESFRQTINTKDSEISRLRTEKDELQAAKTAAEADLRAQLSGIQDQLAAVRNDLEREQELSRTTRLNLENQLGATQQQVRSLMQRRPPEPKEIGPDGKVLAVTADQGTLVLNRGKADHLMTGTRFHVYNYGKGATKQPKGYAVVISVDDTTSRARVVELLDPMRPITPGDEIESATYDPNEKLTFVLLGRFRKYGKTDAERRLQQLGQNTADQVTVETDYLVMGAPEGDEDLRATDLYRQAMELGVRIITEEQLSSFLRY